LNKFILVFFGSSVVAGFMDASLYCWIFAAISALFLLSVIQTPKELTVSILLAVLMASSAGVFILAYKVKTNVVSPIYLLKKPTAYMAEIDNRRIHGY
ncbi:TPA: hypothetical protein OHQ69_005105, partial [Escherichia coli]|nr:hypothetical protein [Escherichia coli]HCQ3180081.1 hypothetical protein [Escherichia coli]